MSNQTTQGNQITKFVYFSLNYPHNFIQVAFKDSHTSAEHLQGKFNTAYERSGATGAMVSFFVELDQRNQELLINYVNTL